MLKTGFTTGTCSAVAAKAAARLLFTKKIQNTEEIVLPKGEKVTIPLYNSVCEENKAVCCVKKYSGDDPDVTNGILIYVSVVLTTKPEIKITGGVGVGKVTKAGLEQPIGEAAINKVPRLMIKNAVEEIFSLYGYEGGGEVTISVPEGVEIAQKTFNPRLGIEGGISILGTTGIIEPMSSQAIIDTIKTEMKFKIANEGKNIILTPGNYGLDFIKNTLNIDLSSAVKISNFVGESLDTAQELGFEHILLIGHIGKLVKIAGGIMNTHSRTADCRMEIITANAVYENVDSNVLKDIMAAPTTD